MREGQGWRLLVGSFLTTIVIVWTWSTASPGLCGLAIDIASLEQKTIPSCLEFWLNRYQTLFAGALALGAALFAAMPVWQQLRETQRQISQQQLQLLRQRAYELHEEKDVMTRAVAHFDASEEAIYWLMKTAPLSAMGLRQLEPTFTAYLDDLGPKVEAFVSIIGKVWGDEQVRSTRRQLLDAVYFTGNCFRDIRSSLLRHGAAASPVPIPAAAVKEIHANVDQYRSAKRSAVDLALALNDVLEAELGRTTEQLAKVEKRIFG